MLRLIIAVVMLGALLWAQGAKLLIDRQSFVEGEEIRLKIVAEGKKVNFPKLKAVGANRLIESSRQQSLSSVTINNKQERHYTTTLNAIFRAKRSATFGPYLVEVDGKNYTTNSVAIKVKKPTGRNKDVKLFYELPKEAVYEGQSFMVKLIFMFKKIDGGEAELPQFKNFMAEQLGQKGPLNRDGYRCYELTYRMTALSAGNFTLPEFGLKSSVRQGAFYKKIKFTSDPATIEVRPVDVDVDLIGHFSASISSKTKKAEINKPIEFVVEIRGMGDLSDFELPAYSINGVSVYPEEPKRSTRSSSGGIYSRYTQRFTFIADGSFDIPSKTIWVFDPKEGRKKQLVIKGLHVVIRDSNGSKIAIEEAKVFAETPSDTPQNSGCDGIGGGYWSYLLVLLGFVVGVIVSSYKKIAQRIKALRPQHMMSHKEALALLYPHTQDSKEVELMVRALYEKIHQKKKVQIDSKALKALIAQYSPNPK